MTRSDRHTEQIGAVERGLRPLGRDRVDPGGERPPEAHLEAPVPGTRVGPDRVVDEGPPPAEHGRDHVLERVAPVGDDCLGVEPVEGGTELGDDEGVVAAGRGICRAPERAIGAHPGWPVEQAQHAVGTDPGFVELIGDGTGLTLGAACHRVRDHVQHEGFVC